MRRIGFVLTLRKFMNSLAGGHELSPVNTWEEFSKLETKYLNLGALLQRHPDPDYINYIAVTAPPTFYQYRLVNVDTGRIEDNPQAVSNPREFPLAPPYVIYHDIRQPFPLPDNSVDRLHSEDCFEHLEYADFPAVFDELHRILKVGGRFRLAVPDYNNPKDAFCVGKGFDPRDPKHLTMTTFEVMKDILARTKFKQINFCHYWHDGKFFRNPIDYKLGYVARTPDNDRRNTGQNPLRITSLVVDLVKSPAD